MTKRIWAGLLALGMALTELPFGIYAEETVWEEEANASEETLDGGLDESAEEFADGLPDYIPEPETDVVDGAADDESADELSEQEESLIEEETTPDLPDFIPEEEPPTLEESELPPVQAGEFVRVTPNTRVYLEIDETAGDDDDGELYDGNFVNEANVYVEEARQDAQGRTWLLIRYLYGAEEPNGEMAWTDTATVWVLAEETRPSDAADAEWQLRRHGDLDDGCGFDSHQPQHRQPDGQQRRGGWRVLLSTQRRHDFRHFHSKHLLDCRAVRFFARRGSGFFNRYSKRGYPKGHHSAVRPACQNEGSAHRV